MATIDSYLSELAEQAHPDGGWGYVPKETPHLEPTVFAILALSQQCEKYQSYIDKANVWIDSCLHKDGLYRLPDARTEAVWGSALVLYLRCVEGHDAETLKPTAQQLLNVHGRIETSKEADDVHDIDLRLRGWPWAEGNFSWVEPTAWACLALRRFGQGDHERVKDGQKLLLDRTFDEGGINYGNRHILGKKLEPEPSPTALALLALQGKDTEERVIASIRYLQEALKDDTDLEHLCMGRIALTLFRSHEGVEDTLRQLDQQIIDAHQHRPDISWLRPSALRQALTALALSADEYCPLRLPDNVSSEATLPMEERAPLKPPIGQRFQNFWKRIAVRAEGILRPAPAESNVHIATVSDYNANLADVLQRQFEHFRESVPLKGKRVVLKPNLVEYHKEKVINTHPHVIAAAIEMCQREGASEVLVAEGPGHWRNLEYLVRESGLGDVLRHHKVKLIDLNHDEPVKRPNLGQLTGLDHLYLTQTICSADVVISMPKLKTHHWAVATLSLKNLFGTMPGICYGWPKNELHWRGIDNSIIDIAMTRTPELAIVDGIIGMEGDGPLKGTSKPMGVLVMGNDLLAVDATCCRLMQLDPEKIAYMFYGYQKKLGQLREDQIQQLGEPIVDLAKPFETLEHHHSIRMGRPA